MDVAARLASGPAEGEPQGRACGVYETDSERVNLGRTLGGEARATRVSAEGTNRGRGGRAYQREIAPPVTSTWARATKPWRPLDPNTVAVTS